MIPIITMLAYSQIIGQSIPFDIDEFFWLASLHFLKNLGFDRIEGNTSKEKSHGFRSKVFTYEEKYTWLSVNCLKAYFNDNFPVTNESKKKISLPSYDYLVDFKNPINPVYILRDSKTFNKWKINENLAPEVLDMNTECIKKEIVKEPILDFSKWIFTDNGSPVLFHDISLKNSNKTISSHLEITACLVSKNFDKELLERYLVAKLDNFLERDDFDRLFCEIDSKSEQHPFDILNSFSGREINTEMKLMEAKNRLIFTITTCKVKSVNDENHYFKLPSEKIRSIFGINHSSENLEYLNSKNEIVITHIFKNNSHDNQRYDDYQEILTFENEKCFELIKSHNLELVWLIEYSLSKNPHNKELSNFYCQKFRRYICWIEDNQLQSRKIWDEYFKSHKDKD